MNAYQYQQTSPYGYAQPPAPIQTNYQPARSRYPTLPGSYVQPSNPNPVVGAGTYRSSYNPYDNAYFRPYKPADTTQPEAY